MVLFVSFYFGSKGTTDSCLGTAEAGLSQQRSASQTGKFAEHAQDIAHALTISTVFQQLMSHILIMNKKTGSNVFILCQRLHLQTTTDPLPMLRFMGSTF